jgi:hypothetical protein
MVNKKRKSTSSIATVKTLPVGPLQSGLTKHTTRRHEQRNMLAGFSPLSVAFDEILIQLRVLSESEGLDVEIVHLLQEAQRWIVSGVDRILSEDGEHEIEESRKLLELEHLLKDFAACPEHIVEWKDAEPWKRPNKFGFGKLRGREEARQSLDEEMVIAARDYWITHSADSHPKPTSDEQPHYEDQSAALLTMLGDLLGHAISVVAAAEPCIEAQGTDVPAAFSDLSTTAINEAWRRMHTTLHSHIPEPIYQTLREPRARRSVPPGPRQRRSD